MAQRSFPHLSIFHRQHLWNYNRKYLEALIEDALPLCVDVARRRGGHLTTIDLVEVSIVNKQTIARIHREYLNLSGATDVITFPYGEIFVCAAVAGTRASEFSHTITEELALYIIHGLLHLAGHTDATPGEAEQMAQQQKRILQAVQTKLC